MNTAATYGAVILAAGASRRLGSPKQLVHYEGRSLIARTTEIIAEHIDGPIQVVTGAQHAGIEAALELHTNTRLQTCYNSDWQAGMGASLAYGTSRLRALAPQLKHILISVCDQPHLSSEVFVRLLDQAQRHPNHIIVSDYGSAKGPPVCFPPIYFNALCQLSGDQGAKSIIQSNSHAVRTIDFPEGAFDIDTPATLKQLNSPSNL